LAPVDDPAYDLLLALIAFPILVVFAARASYSGPAARMCLALGRLSYPLYLVHWPVYRMVQGTSEVLRPGASPWVMVLGGAVLSVIAAELLLVAFDEPVRRWLNRQLRLRRSPTGAAA